MSDDANKTLNVKGSTKTKFMVVKTILGISQDELLIKLMEENNKVNKFINFNEEFEPVVIKELT